MSKLRIEQALDLLNDAVAEREENFSFRSQEWDEDKRADFSDMTQQLSALADDLSGLVGEVKDESE